MVVIIAVRFVQFLGLEEKVEVLQSTKQLILQKKYQNRKQKK